MKTVIKSVLVSIFLIAISFDLSGQCFVGKNQLQGIVAYTPRKVRIYERGGSTFEVKATAEKMINGSKVSFNLIFEVTGQIKYIVIPDIAEITTVSGKTISLYLPDRSNQHMTEYSATAECYGEFNENDNEIQLLMSEEISRIVLKNDKESVAIKPPANLFTSMFYCLKNKN